MLSNTKEERLGGRLNMSTTAVDFEACDGVSQGVGTVPHRYSQQEGSSVSKRLMEDDRRCNESGVCPVFVIV